MRLRGRVGHFGCDDVVPIAQLCREVPGKHAAPVGRPHVTGALDEQQGLRAYNRFSDTRRQSGTDIWAELSDDFEGALTAWTEPDDGEVIIETRNAQEAESQHDGEAGSVDDREVLIGEVAADGPGPLEVGAPDRFDACDAGSQSVPEPFRNGPAEAVIQQQPRLDQDMVARDERLPGTQYGRGPIVRAVAAVRPGVEGGAIDEECQGLSPAPASGIDGGPDVHILVAGDVRATAVAQGEDC